MIFEFLSNSIYLSALYFNIAISFFLIYKSIKVFHFAHAALFTLTSFCFCMFYVTFSVPLLGAIFLSNIPSLIIAFFLQEYIYNPGKNRISSIGLMIASFAAYIVIINAISFFGGIETKIVYVKAIQKFEFLGLNFNFIQLFSIILFLLVISGIIFLKKWKGRSLFYAIIGNEELLSILGYNTHTIKIVLILLGTFILNLQSILYTMDLGYDPYWGTSLFLIGATASLLGGKKNISFIILFSFVFGILKNFSLLFVSSQWIDTIIYSFILMVLLLSPNTTLQFQNREV